VAPLLRVSETFAGGLGRFDLSCCAFTEDVINKQKLKTITEKYFMAIHFYNGR
jgi:hypothetical protein